MVKVGCEATSSMVKTILTGLALSCWVLAATASAQPVEWVRTYSGPHGGDSVYRMVVDTSGNIYVFGRNRKGTDDFSFATVKYSPAGEELWVAVYDPPEQKCWMSSHSDEMIVVDGEGNVYVSGMCYGEETPRKDHIVIIRYDVDGKEVWVARHDEPSYFRTMSLDSLGNVYVTGYEVLDEDQHYLTIKYRAADACKGKEAIESAACMTRRGRVTKVLVVVTNATPDKEYAAKLDSGEEAIKHAKGNGTVRFRFKGENAPECGSNGVTVCDQHKDFNCDC